MLKSLFTRAIAFAGILAASVTSHAIELDPPLFTTPIPGDPISVSINQATGTVIIFSIVSGEVVMYDENGNKLADCTADLGLSNFSTDPFDEMKLTDSSGSRVTRVFGSIASILNYDIPAGLSNVTVKFFAVDCNNPGTRVSYPDNFLLRYATNNYSIGNLNENGVPEPVIYSESTFTSLNASDVPSWAPSAGNLNGSTLGGFAFNSTILSGSAYLFGVGFIGSGEGQVLKIIPSPLDPDTVIFSDAGKTKYFLPSSSATGEFTGFDIIDSTELGFLLANGSNCLVVKDTADISGSSSVGTNCVDSLTVGTQLYVLVDGVLKVYETTPTPEPLPTTAIVFGNCIDADGDGWGWDGTRSCRIPPGIQNSNENSAANCIDIPPLNDGWGWNFAREKSCRIPRSNNPQSNASAIQCIDTDGDGWGWTGTESCRV